MDALAYSSIKSNLDPSADKAVLDRLDFAYREKYFTNKDINLTDVSINNEITNVLNNTSIKRACCRKRSDNKGNYVVDVKIFKPIEFDSEGSLSALYNKFNYYIKEVLIPASYCDTYAADNNISFGGTDSPTYCDFFYDSYCENSKKIFSNFYEPGTSWDYDSFKEYSPDCACYQPDPPALANFETVGIPSTCFLSTYGCGDSEISGKTAYITSSQTNRNCGTGTICANTININNSEIGALIGNVNMTIGTCGDVTASGTPASGTTANDTPASGTTASDSISNDAPASGSVSDSATASGSVSDSAPASGSVSDSAPASGSVSDSATSNPSATNDTPTQVVASSSSGSGSGSGSGSDSGSGSGSGYTDWAMIGGLIGGGIVLLIIIIIIVAIYCF